MLILRLADFTRYILRDTVTESQTADIYNLFGMQKLNLLSQRGSNDVNQRLGCFFSKVYWLAERMVTSDNRKEIMQRSQMALNILGLALSPDENLPDELTNSALKLWLNDALRFGKPLTTNLLKAEPEPASVVREEIHIIRGNKDQVQVRFETRCKPYDATLDTSEEMARKHAAILAFCLSDERLAFINKEGIPHRWFKNQLDLLLFHFACQSYNANPEKFAFEKAEHVKRIQPFLPKDLAFLPKDLDGHVLFSEAMIEPDQPSFSKTLHEHYIIYLDSRLLEMCAIREAKVALCYQKKNISFECAANYLKSNLTFLAFVRDEYEPYWNTSFLDETYWMRLTNFVTSIMDNIPLTWANETQQDEFAKTLYLCVDFLCSGDVQTRNPEAASYLTCLFKGIHRLASQLTEADLIKLVDAFKKLSPAGARLLYFFQGKPVPAEQLLASVTPQKSKTAKRRTRPGHHSLFRQSVEKVTAASSTPIEARVEDDPDQEEQSEPGIVDVVPEFTSGLSAMAPSFTPSVLRPIEIGLHTTAQEILSLIDSQIKAPLPDETIYLMSRFAQPIFFHLSREEHQQALLDVIALFWTVENVLFFHRLLVDYGLTLLLFPLSAQVAYQHPYRAEYIWVLDDELCKLSNTPTETRDLGPLRNLLNDPESALPEQYRNRYGLFSKTAQDPEMLAEEERQWQCHNRFLL